MSEHLFCSFCSKEANEVKLLIGGTSVHICDECVNLCYGIVNQPPKGKDGKLPTPREIKEFLDQYVIGQDAAKEFLSVAVYNHYKRLDNPVVDDVELEKSNILIVGPTGSGKTLLAQTIARLLDVPFAIADATSLTEAGYVGDDVESIITRLLQAAGQDVEKAERGIVYIDEIDKKRSKGEGGSGTRDVSGEGVQQALLKIIEGSEVFVPQQGGRKNQNQQSVKVNTKNILFIVGGAFVGLEKVIQSELDKGTSAIGFGAERVGRKQRNLSELIAKAEPSHLVRFGLIPEMVGRLPVITALDELTEDQLVHILSKPKNAVTKQFAKLFKLDEVELVFDEEALRAVAKLAITRKTGARGLRSVIEHSLKKLQFSLPDLKSAGLEKVTIHEGVITRDEEPTFEYAAPEAVVSE